MLLAMAAIAILAARRPAAQELQPGTTFRDCPHCPEMVVIPPGKFLMGSSKVDTQRELAEVPRSHFGLAIMLGWTSRGRAQKFMAYENPQHSITIPQAFALGRYPVTRGQFAAFVRDIGYITGPCLVLGYRGRPIQIPHSGWSDPGFEQTDRDPVVCITWNDAKAYIAWLNRKLRDETHSPRTYAPYRLPSEAEWEYAARAGTQTSRWWGNAMAPGYANCDGCNGHVRLAVWFDGRWMHPQATVPVGSFPPNPFGLYDMLGNAGELVEDCWHDTYDGAPADGRAWIDDDCTERVVRGGAWLGLAWTVRSATRSGRSADSAANTDGFRVAKTLR